MPDKYLTSYKEAMGLFKEGVRLIDAFDKENYEFVGLKLSSFDIKKWTKQDYINFGSHSAGFRNVKHVLLICQGASEREYVVDANGKHVMENGKPKIAYTADALRAQEALKDILPSSCKTWQDFYYMMVEVQKEVGPAIEELYKKYPLGTVTPSATPKASSGAKKPVRTGMLLQEYRFENLAGDPREDASFGEAQALELLHKNGVAVDASHELKKPLETAVTEAVKGIKSSVAIAS